MIRILFFISYLFIYAQHFLWSENVYAHNLSRILLVIYWGFASLSFISFFAMESLYGGKTEKERLTFWRKTTKRTVFQNIRETVNSVLIIGMGVIGEWPYFTPLIILEIMGLIIKAHCKTQLEEYLKIHAIPEEKIETKKPRKAQSRYNLIKD